MKILLLGAGGFIGSHLVGHLLRATQHRVVGLDLGAEKLEEVISSPRFEFHHADIRTAGRLLDGLVADADLVVDLIAHANPSIYVSAPLEVFDLNFLQNLSIARLCVSHRKRLIQYSSAEVYGRPGDNDLCREDSSDSIFGPVAKQRWIYANAKLMLERLLYAYGVAGQLEYTIVRPFNFIGPRIDYLVPAGAIGGPRVFPHFMSALLTGGPIRLVGGGVFHRAFLHIDDASRAFQALLDYPEEARNQIFNVGNPANNITIQGLAQVMIEVYQELTGRAAASEVVEMTGEEFYGTGYDDDDRLPPDISKLQTLGWQPQHDLRSTLRDAMRFYLVERNAQASREYASVAATVIRDQSVRHDHAIADQDLSRELV